MNSISIAGNVGKNAEVRTVGDKRVANFSVAVSEGRDKTTWFDCGLWGDRADKLAQYITKGSKIAVTGAVSARAHDGKAYLQVFVNQVTFMSSRTEGQERPQEQQSQTYGSGGHAIDDEIPFYPEVR